MRDLTKLDVGEIVRKLAYWASVVGWYQHPVLDTIAAHVNAHEYKCALACAESLHQEFGGDKNNMGWDDTSAYALDFVTYLREICRR